MNKIYRKWCIDGVHTMDVHQDGYGISIDVEHHLVETTASFNLKIEELDELISYLQEVKTFINRRN